MEARKRQRVDKCMPEVIEWTLPIELLLEIVARSDTRTLVRCAATSKLLRHDIFGPSFIHRVTREGGILPGCILTYLNTHDDEANPPPPLTLVHPATSAAAKSFLEDHMCPYMSRFADDLLGEHIPIMSRGGLVLFRRRHASDRLSNLCVHDLITGHRTFLSDPPDMSSNGTRGFVLLTALDGIECYFMLFFANRKGTHIVQVRTGTSRRGTWAPAAMVHQSRGFLPPDVVVLYGGVIHWLQRRRGEIVTYNVCTMEQGTIMLPALITNFKGGWSNLGSYYSHDGRKLLRLMIFKEFKMYVWHQLADGDWAPGDATIDMEEKLRSLDPNINIERIVRVEFTWCSEGSNIVLLRICRHSPGSRRALVIWLDLETKEMLAHQHSRTKHSSTLSMLLEVNLPSRLRALKTFSLQNSS